MVPFGPVNVVNDNRFSRFIVKNVIPEKVLHQVYDKDKATLYFICDTIVYRLHAATRTLRAIDTLAGQEKAIKTFFFRNRLFLFTNTGMLLSYDTDYPQKPLITKGTYPVYEFYELRHNRYLVKTHHGYYVADLSYNDIRKTKIWKIEYPFKNADILLMYPFKDSILCCAKDKVYTFHQSIIEKAPRKPEFSISGITINGQKYLQHSISLRHKDGCDVNITLSPLYFGNTENIYQYRISRNDKTGIWYSSTATDLNVLLPRFGNYRVEIRQVSERDIASDTQVISIMLSPPFYLTAWFTAAVISIIFGCIYYIIYRNSQKRKRKFQNELHYMQLEHRAINSLLNPHFIFNAINNIQNLVNEKNAKEANEYLATLSKLIRQNIENLQFTLIPIEKELLLVMNYVRLQNLRFNGNINLVINNNVGILDAINIPPLLIHTMVENAIVHGYKKDNTGFCITVNIDLADNDYLVLTIKDNGVGISAQPAQHIIKDKHSFGIEFTRRRLERLSDFYEVSHSLSFIDLKEHNGQGTEVVVTIYSKLRN
jgi:cbb3-type cytochrome oxidase subunit 3